MSRFYSDLTTLAQLAKAWHRRGFVDEPQFAEPSEPEALTVAETPSTAKISIPTAITIDPSLDRATAIGRLNAMVNNCRNCQLCAKRTKAVPGTGALTPAVMVIGEGPGADEDRLGLPFVGAAGQYLDKWLEAIGLSRYQNCYIANVVKCRPPQNRDPLPEEIAACTPYLVQQIQILRPKALLVVGRVAAGYLLGQPVKMHEVHGKFFTFESIPLMATFHPAAVLRDQSLRQAVWDDLKSFRGKFLD